MNSSLSLDSLPQRIMLWSLGAAAVAGLLAVMAGNYNVVGRVAATACVAALVSGTMWRLGGMLNDQNKRVIGLLGMSSAIACFLVALLAIWVARGQSG